MFTNSKRRRNLGFTLIELLIVIGILAVLATVTVLLLNPSQYTAQGRDVRRISDLRSIDIAVSLAKNPLYGVVADSTQANIVYLSLPDISDPPNPDDDCGTNGEYSLPTLPSSWQYRCRATEANLRKVNGDGWIPIDFASISVDPLTVLPIDPVNDQTYYYTYSWDVSDKTTMAVKLESNKYLDSHANNTKGDGGNDDIIYETRPITWNYIDRVDIGNSDSEGGYSLIGWGPIEPITNGGTWGGCGDTNPCNLRVVYAYEEGTDNTGKDASFTLDFGIDAISAKTLVLRVLDGADIDDFTVEIDGVSKYFYNALGGGENWIEHNIDVTGYINLHTIRIITTDYNTPSAWVYFNPYGHLGIDWAKVR